MYISLADLSFSLNGMVDFGVSRYEESLYSSEKTNYCGVSTGCAKYLYSLRLAAFNRHHFLNLKTVMLMICMKVLTKMILT